MPNDGGPAFPEMKSVGADGVHMTETNPGMSLRDYFAAKAMQGIIAGAGNQVPVSPENTADLAKLSYEFADAILKARGP